MGDGIYVEGLINSEIFNNMITTNVTGSMNWRQGTDWVASGIHLQYAQNIKIYNNSLIGGFTAEYGNLSGIEFYNNSCYSDSAIMLFTTTAIYSGGNNNFYRKDGGFLVSIDDTAYTVIDSVNIASGQEKFSISNDPLYQSKTDLHTSSPYLQGRGRPYQSLTFDIDGDSRDQVHPAIGADENSITPINTRPQLISTLPANNRTSVPVDTSLILIFDRSICLNQGTIELYNFDTNSFIQMITLPSNYVVLIDTNKLKVPLIHNLAYGTHYYVTLSANTVYNYGMGNNLTNNPLSFNFTTKITAPTVTTQSVNSITTNQGIVTINIISDGGSAVLKSGVCWSTTGSPDFYSNNITSNSNLTGNHNLLLNALIPNTTYYVKAYAINQVDTVYGAVLSFRTDAISISTNVLYEKESISISIFPNPIISDMEIELSSNNLSLEIYSTLGILLYNQTMKEGLSVVPLAQLPQGLYYVRVLKEGKAIYVTEIVKE